MSAARRNSAEAAEQSVAAMDENSQAQDLSFWTCCIGLGGLQPPVYQVTRGDLTPR